LLLKGFHLFVAVLPIFRGLLDGVGIGIRSNPFIASGNATAMAAAPQCAGLLAAILRFRVDDPPSFLGHARSTAPLVSVFPLSIQRKQSGAI
jgi:hypothetical protein